jgi:hypothetical protein
MSLLELGMIDEFQDRFYSFNDSVLRKLEISYARDGGQSVAAVIATRDAKQIQNDGWVCVRLVVSGVQDFCFADTANTSAAVLSNGVHICWFEGLLASTSATLLTGRRVWRN